jgi:hypothetical protein
VAAARPARASDPAPEARHDRRPLTRPSPPRGERGKDAER